MEALTGTASPSTPLLDPPRSLAEPSPLQLRIKAADDRASEITNKVWRLRDTHAITDIEAKSFERQLASWVSMLAALSEQAALVELRKRDQQKKAATRAAAPAPTAPEPEDEAEDDSQDDASVIESYELALSKQTATVESALSALNAQLAESENATGWKLVGTILRARCRTAICFDNGAKKDWLGIEPLVELPVGKSFALSKSSLSNYVDNHELRIDLAAGARVWLFRDIVSLSVYISKPLTEDRIRLEVHPSSIPGPPSVARIQASRWGYCSTRFGWASIATSCETATGKTPWRSIRTLHPTRTCHRLGRSR